MNAVVREGFSGVWVVARELMDWRKIVALTPCTVTVGLV